MGQKFSWPVLREAVAAVLPSGGRWPRGPGKQGAAAQPPAGVEPVPGEDVPRFLREHVRVVLHQVQVLGAEQVEEEDNLTDD